MEWIESKYFIASIIHLQSKKITCIFLSILKRTRIFVHRISTFFSSIVFFLYNSLSRMKPPEEIIEWILRQIEENREKNATRMSEIENRQKRIRFIYEFINQKMLVSIMLFFAFVTIFIYAYSFQNCGKLKNVNCAS